MGNTELRIIPIQSNNTFVASSDGHILRLLRTKPNSNRQTNSKYLKHDNKWYRYLKPALNGKNRNYLRVEIDKRAYFVHRLVLSAFHPVEGWQDLQVNHLSMDTSDNSITNLEWVSNAENAFHRGIYRKYRPSYDQIRLNAAESFRDVNTSEPEPRQVIGSWQVKYDIPEIERLLLEGKLTCSEIARQLGIKETAVSYHKRRLKLPSVSRKAKIDETRLVSLVESGLTYAKVGELLGITKGTVYLKYKEIKVQRLSKSNSPELNLVE